MYPTSFSWDFCTWIHLQSSYPNDAHKCRGGCQRGWARFSSAAPGNWPRANENKQEYRKFYLNMRKNLLTFRVTEHWKIAQRGWGVSFSGDVLCLDISYTFCPGWTYLSRRVGLENVQRALPTQTIHWLCDSIILYLGYSTLIWCKNSTAPDFNLLLLYLPKWWLKFSCRVSTCLYSFHNQH